ncbi:hypothetical protein ACI1TN_02075 [Lactococcus garvieae]|uniref:hypothetical protein n=1 Tax=Lactococcus TaxID=1357 RepID=UPI00254FC02E|nr:hypothetical protein [Lactococcus petauri]
MQRYEEGHERSREIGQRERTSLKVNNDEARAVLLQYFPGFSLLEIDRMSMEEIDIRLKTIELIDLKSKDNQVQSAFMKRVVNVTEERNGQTFYKFDTPESIFDYKKAKLAVFGKIPEEDRTKIEELKRNEQLFEEIFGEEA